MFVLRSFASSRRHKCVCIPASWHVLLPSDAPILGVRVHVLLRSDAPCQPNTRTHAHMRGQNNDVGPMLAGLITIIAIFALLFAVNSSIHSYLVVRYAEGNKVAQSVGFYYMSNAAGRLMGTLVSGALYSYVDTKNATNGIGVYVVLEGVGLMV
jgi:hypothetical protein